VFTGPKVVFSLDLEGICGIWFKKIGATCNLGRVRSEGSVPGPEWQARAGVKGVTSRKESITLVNGTVKWFSNKKGCGFIEQETGSDIFIHDSSINIQGFKSFGEGESVNSDREESDRGVVAKNITTLL